MEAVVLKKKPSLIVVESKACVPGWPAKTKFPKKKKTKFFEPIIRIEFYFS